MNGHARRVASWAQWSGDDDEWLVNITYNSGLDVGSDMRRIERARYWYSVRDSEDRGE